MTTKLFFSIVLLCIGTFLQEFFLSHLALFQVSPDIMTIFIVFIAITVDQKSSTSFGFAAGILTGIFSGNMGLNMLARTIEGFIAGYFHIPEESHATARQKTRKFYVAILAAGFFGHAVIAAGYNPLGLTPAYRIFILGFLESLFTLMLAVILNWLFLRKSFAD
ncbi:MAG: rod shape-determining protein MreD [Chlorobium sp.]|nr:MAG: rod shape-determining protein MreD [Chlorobium sp.]